MDTQVGGDIANGNMGGVFNIKGFDKIKALQIPCWSAMTGRTI